MWYKDAQKKVLAVPDLPAVRAHLIAAFHDVPYAAHRGRDHTVGLLSAHYWWVTLAQDVATYVRECSSCQANTPRNTLPPGLLQPEEIAANVFDTMSIDFIFHLPKSSSGKSGCMTVVDKASRAAVLIPVSSEKLTATTAASLFRNHVFSRGWGIPLKLVSDRDPRFLSQFWTTLHQLLGTRLAMSTAYHAQTDGPTEVVHRELNDMLRNSAGVLWNRWSDHVDLLEFAHYNHVNASTGVSPFVMLYGRAPRTPSTLLADQVPDGAEDALPDLQAFLQMKRLVLALAERNVVAAQARQKHYYDKGRSPNPDFPVGALVYLSSEHYRLSPETSKVEPRWLGPFPVLERVGELNYRLQLPSYMERVHDVFHCSVLKAHVPQTAFVHPPPSVPVLNPPATLELILGHKRLKGGGYTFSIKLLDKPLPEVPVWMKEKDARALSPEVVATYKAAHHI